jgi:FAD/FMN-containing dehydrogenase
MSQRVSRRTFLGASAAASAALAGCSQHGPLPDPTRRPGADTCGGDATFHNWAGTIQCTPTRFCQPETEDQVVAIVKDALDSGKRVRTVGGGHSWSPLVLTRDVLVNLDRMQAVRFDAQSRTATVQAGIRLKNLTPFLAEKGLGMANLGSIREQSIAGATSTGTHGTGLTLGSLSTQIVGMRLVTGTGDVRTLTASDGEVFHAARVGLGALGIVTEVTIQCVPDYTLEYAAYLCRFDDVLLKLDTLVQENVRVRLWWLVPDSGDRERVIVTTMNPPGTPLGVMGPAARPSPASSRSKAGSSPPMDTDELLKRWLGRTASGCTPFLRFTGNYVQVLTVPLLEVPHRECEYAVPVENAIDALRGFKRGLDEGGLGLKLPVEVRFVARDDNLLSTARGRDVCYIGASTQANAPEVFEVFEPLMKRLGGRPHWGKWFSLTQEGARAMYPDSFDTFRKIRMDLDPKGVFANELLRSLLD